MSHILPALLAVAAILPLRAQTILTLQQAVQLSLAKHPAVDAAASQIRAADARVRQARSGVMPRVNYTESFARSDNPVFVFGSLLSQHQFTESNFEVGRLNRPDFLNNFQSQVTVEQTVYDWGATRAQVRSAVLGRGASEQQERRVRMELVSRAVRAYYGSVLARASLDVARDAVKSAEADAARAQSVRQAGMSTDADLLSIQVHTAAVREQEIRRGYELDVAMAALNEAMGLPLDTKHELPTMLLSSDVAAGAVSEFEKAAELERPEAKQSQLGVRTAEQQKVAARAGLLPQFGVRGGFEVNRQEFLRKGGANWMVAASMRWNLFDGFAGRARMAEAQAVLDSARAQQRQVEAAVRLEVHKAWADARAATERIAVATAAVTQAEESLRIIKNRFEAGLTTVTELLRNETALLEAQTRRLAAIHDQRVAAAQLELAAGRLSADSEILR